ncbi:MAG: TMEM175 family protein [Marmoricola sp.]
MTESLRERERDLDRFLTFVDAVVAIAITLLVLPLAEVAGDAVNGSVGDLLRENEALLLGFLLSFLVIAQLWFSQHRIVSNLVVQNPLVTRLMLAWTLTIVLLPFPTALVATAGSDPVTKVFYIGTMAISSSLLGLMAWAVGRERSIRDTDSQPDPAPAVATVLGFALALAISLMFPDTSYYPLLLLLLTDPLTHALRRARGGRPHATHMGE